MKIKTVLIALFISVFGLSSSSVLADAVKVRDYSDLKNIDPAFSGGLFDEGIQSLIYSKLIQLKPGSWDYVLDAAESIEQTTPALWIQLHLEHNPMIQVLSLIHI